jgi:hypothetical protein
MLGWMGFECVCLGCVFAQAQCYGMMKARRNVSARPGGLLSFCRRHLVDRARDIWGQRAEFSFSFWFFLRHKNAKLF